MRGSRGAPRGPAAGAAPWLPPLALALALAAPAGHAAALTPCGAAVVTTPRAGEAITGTVRILGSADIPGFNFYKLEWATAENPEQWIAVSTIVSSAVRHGVLDRWATAGRTAGAYRLKLTVVDGEFQERCRFFVEGLTLGGAAADSAERAAAATVPARERLDLPTAAPEAPTTAPAPPPTVVPAAGAPTDAPASPSPTDLPSAGADATDEAPATPDAPVPEPEATGEASRGAPTTAAADEESAGAVAADLGTSSGDESTPGATAPAPTSAAQRVAAAGRGFLVGFALVMAAAAGLVAARMTWLRSARR